MNYNFFIVDDDYSIVKILSNIILNHKLGDVCGFATNSEEAIKEIKRLKPDIVLLDLLLPDRDGISITNALKPTLPETPFIMISEVYAKEMVSKAYTAGVEYYINKPINVIEVINVIKRVDERMKMKHVIDTFQSAIKHIKSFDSPEPIIEESDFKERARLILHQLGIISENGAQDIINLIAFLTGMDDGIKRRVLDYKLSSLYEYLSDKYERERGEVINVKTIEQRIRRTINQGLINLSELGLQDFDDVLFMRYGNSLYDFRELRKEMNHIKGTGEGGKINIRKFFMGLVHEIQHLQ